MQEEAGAQREGVYAAGFRVTMPLAPATAIGVTILAYIIYSEASPKDVLPLSASAYAVIIGVLFTSVIWLVGGWIYSRYTTAANVSRRNYLSLCERLDQLENRVMYARTEGYESGANTDIAICQATREQAYARAQKECKVISEKLKGAGMPWITGLGYINLWHRVHRAEESLIKVEPCLEALEGAMRDESRLVNSTLENKDSLLKRLRCAVAMLDDSGTEKYLSYVIEQEKCPLGKEERSTPANRAKALTILSEVRYEINHFRDNVWEGIVHARNRLAYTSVVLGLATYALLGLAIFAGAHHDMIIWAVAYFLVGATIGLFARAQGEWNANTAIDDFGLSTACLLHIPCLSGLAAVGGVLVTLIIDTHLLNNSAATTTANLANIFKDSPSFLIVAAVFGLTPDLIIRRLTQQVDKYKEDLETTQSSQGTEEVQVSKGSRSTRRQAG